MLERHVSESTMRAIVTPIFADLDYELDRAARAESRMLAHVRCYVALLRVGVACRFGLGLTRRALVVLALTAVGVTSVIWTAHLLDKDDAILGVFAVMALAGPLALRLLGAGRSYGQMFWNCLTVGACMVLTVVTYYTIEYGRGPRQPLAAFVILSAFTIVGSLALAGIASGRLGRGSVGRALLAGVLVYLAPVFVPEILIERDIELRLFIGIFINSLIIGSALLLFHLPAFLVARRSVRSRWSSALVGGLLCVGPMLGLDFFAGEFGPDWFWGDYADGSVTRFVRDAWSYFLATATMGWCLGPRASNQPEPRVSVAS